jgi:hypothetical protein
VICSFNSIPLKIPVVYFTDIKKPPKHSYRISRDPPIAKTILKTMNKIGDLTLPNFKTYMNSSNQCGAGIMTYM